MTTEGKQERIIIFPFVTIKKNIVIGKDENAQNNAKHQVLSFLKDPLKFSIW